MDASFQGLLGGRIVLLVCSSGTQRLEFPYLDLAHVRELTWLAGLEAIG